MSNVLIFATLLPGLASQAIAAAAEMRALCRRVLRRLAGRHAAVQARTVAAAVALRGMLVIVLVGVAGMGPVHAEDRAASSPQLGVASWYGHDHAGKLTAAGMPFAPEDLTAAHRRLPLGTLVRVTHVASGRQVIVTINDRGPYIRGRILDLSLAAAEQLGMTARGLAKVRIEIL